MTASESPGYSEQTRAAQRLPLTHLEAAGQGSLSGQYLTTHPSPQRYQFVEVPGNHYVHMNTPQVVAGVISSFLQGLLPLPSSQL